MEIAIKGEVSEDPKSRIIALESITQSICERTGQDQAEGVMMLLTAAAHMSIKYSKPSVTLQQSAQKLAECLGYAIVAADDFFALKDIKANQSKVQEGK